MLPAQKSVTLSPAEWKIMDTKIRFFIPRDHYGQLKTRQSSKMLEISIFPGILSNDNSNTIKLMVKNYGNSKTEVTEGDYIADLLIAPVLHPVLFPISTIEMVSKKGLDAQDCLKGEISRDLKIERLEDAIVEPHPRSKLDYSEMTLLNTIILDKKKGRSVDFPDYLERENQKDNHHHPSEFSPVELTQVPSYPPDFEKTIKFEMPASSDAMTLKNGRLLASHSQKTAKLYYSLEKPYDLHLFQLTNLLNLIASAMVRKTKTVSSNTVTPLALSDLHLQLEGLEKEHQSLLKQIKKKRTELNNFVEKMRSLATEVFHRVSPNMQTMAELDAEIHALFAEILNTRKMGKQTKPSSRQSTQASLVETLT